MKIIDLSLTISAGMATYPGDPDVSIDVVQDYREHTWQVRKICFGSHTGTHVDAYSHMDPNGSTLDRIPLEHFFGKAVAVEQPFVLPRRVGLIFLNETDTEALDAILAAGPPFVGGLISEDLERLLLEKRIVTYTNLVNLELLPVNKEFIFCGLPLKIKDGDGSPVRAAAILDAGF